MEEKLPEVRFQLFSIKFTPFKGSDLNSRQIIINIITNLSKMLVEEKKGYLLDRHETRNQNSRRELFINSVVFLAKEKRVRGSIALLRGDKVPMIKPKEEFTLVPITEKLNGSIAEVTNFFIDYSRADQVIICCEYNFFGPRITDLEYYFRHIGNKVLRESKATEVTAFMVAPIDETLEKLKNVLDIDLKIDPVNIERLTPDVQNKYFSGLKNLNKVLEPRFFRVKAYFQAPGENVDSKVFNTSANNMVRDLLRRFKGNALDIDAFKDFKFKFEDKEGNEEVFNLLSGKKEFVLNVDPKKIKTSRDWYELIKVELDAFIGK